MFFFNRNVLFIINIIFCVVNSGLLCIGIFVIKLWEIVLYCKFLLGFKGINNFFLKVV